MEQERLGEVVLPLLQWFSEHARTLPWRSDPTPYHVWVSEIMLQQTRVAAVLDYYRRFMDELPTAADLAAVDEERLLKLWQGLGYYNRARNLQKAARQVMDEFGGTFPASYDAIRSLAGVGDYTAGAIASIAFGLPVPAVDGNVLRVLSRILGDEQDISRPSTKDWARALLLKVIPARRPGDFNQALMELGATVCLPNGAPLCGQCPAAPFCEALRTDRTGALPVKAAKKARRIEERTVYLLFRSGRVALRRRPRPGLLAGLWEYPNALRGEDPIPGWGISVPALEFGGTGRHIFSHIEWHMTAQMGETETEALPSGWVWADRAGLRDVYAVPGAFEAFRAKVEEHLR